MPAIEINLTIPANKNVDDRALKSFIKVFENPTANEESEDYVPPNPPQNPDAGVSDKEWLVLWLRKQLVAVINEGRRRIRVENIPQTDDPDVADMPPRKPTTPGTGGTPMDVRVKDVL